MINLTRITDMTDRPRLKRRLHIVIASLIALTFILIIARLATPGTPVTRTNIWGIVVCLKAALFLTYQVLTTYKDRFKRWASLKANMILDIIDTLFWFALFIISIIGASGGHSAASKTLGAFVAILSLVLCGVVGLLSYLCILDYRYFKAHGTANIYAHEEVKAEVV
ncbi:Ubiquitin-conjugating enzyme family protein [Aspergillus niger]|uniref:Ubiquitin-conjugating enzyme family protein n=2 Tax=Aspergillus niger TaxID=5061 RepID=A0A505HVM0_ASPNG|nr:hypothetical protein ANI_1_466054 [Aspergillus niger CBS 513.88]RDH19317.1 hypothetical protein M747DRAFT_342506 [Aspergillus niger ATCC 13496]TPR02629.1 Ubiquitin-conjugating enzyme family protein [Aspergillus niger]|eukprot:XP_003188699.1 hypothetical protein ANI_1_466054 [Aspergillus niger CBS 513.88]